MAEDGDNCPIIMDNGSSTIKADYATETAPNHDIPSVVGVPKGYMQNIG